MFVNWRVGLHRARALSLLIVIATVSYSRSDFEVAASESSGRFLQIGPDSPAERLFHVDVHGILLFIILWLDE